MSGKHIWRSGMLVAVGALSGVGGAYLMYQAIAYTPPVAEGMRNIGPHFLTFKLTGQGMDVGTWQSMHFKAYNYAHAPLAFLKRGRARQIWLELASKGDVYAMEALKEQEADPAARLPWVREMARAGLVFGYSEFLTQIGRDERGYFIPVAPPSRPLLTAEDAALIKAARGVELDGTSYLLSRYYMTTQPPQMAKAQAWEEMSKLIRDKGETWCSRKTVPPTCEADLPPILEAKLQRLLADE